MFRRIFTTVLAALCCCGLALPAAAAEVESGTRYCFSSTDFSAEETVTGICITDLPKEEGSQAHVVFSSVIPP